MSESLYNLSDALARIGDEIAANEGELTDELEKRLDGLNLDFDSKVENISKWCRNLSGRETALDVEIKRLQARKEATDNLQKRLKNYMQMCMEMAGKSKVEFDTFTVAVQRNPVSLEITDEKTIPAKYITIVPEQKVIDRRAILADLKTGISIEGAKLIDDKKHLRIR